MSEHPRVVVVHGTGKFLDRVRRPTIGPDGRSTTALGSWYATVLFWRPQVALFVNETTLLPVLVPFAPAATVLARFPAALERILDAHAVAPSFTAVELAGMTEIRLAKTANRSLIGVMNDFGRLAEYRRDLGDLDVISLELAHTPMGPLHKTHGFPDRALQVLVSQVTGLDSAGPSA